MHDFEELQLRIFMIKKMADYFDYLKTTRSQIYCLQDVHWDQNLSNTVTKE